MDSSSNNSITKKINREVKSDKSAAWPEKGSQREVSGGQDGGFSED